MIKARLYRGDLLHSLLEMPSGYWQNHPEQRRDAACIAVDALNQAADCPDTWQEEILPALYEAYDRFAGKLASRAWLRPEEG